MCLVITLGSSAELLRLQRGFSKSHSDQLRAQERLSSGLRINRGADDPAGLAVSQKLNVDARVYAQAIKNLNDGVSLINIGEGALDQLSTIVTRQAELSEQAANGVYSAKQREALHDEAAALTAEYNRIIGVTSFNGVSLYGDGETELRLQGGYGIENSFNLELGAEISSLVGNGQFAASTSQALSFGWREATGDFNNDGNLDRATASAGAFRIYAGNGTGAINTTALSASTASGVNGIAAGDYNGDGYLDLAGVSNTNGALYVSLGSSTGTLATAISYSGALSGAETTQAGDIDGDGDLDLIGAGAGSVRVYVNQGNGTFTHTTSMAGGGSLGGILADVNNDSFADVISGGSVYISNGNGYFRAALTVGSGDSTAGDVNGDGNIDIISTPGNTLSVFLGNGNGTFLAARNSTVAAGAVHPTVADLNNDGNLDIGMADQGTSVSILFGNGNGTFLSRVSLATPSLRWFGVGDMDNDGVLDLLPSSQTGYTAFLKGLSSASARYSGIDLTTQQSARSALTITAEKLNDINKERGSLGALQTRLEVANRVLAVSQENFKAAESRIVDTDFAEESAVYIAAQIRKNVAASLLPQMNQQSQIALRLLG